MTTIEIPSYSWVIFVLIVWELAWKGIALWKSARRNDPIWYIAILVINSLGLLPILYIFVFSKREALKDKNQA